jgi:hypothetical protein
MWKKGQGQEETRRKDIETTLEEKENTRVETKTLSKYGYGIFFYGMFIANLGTFSFSVVQPTVSQSIQVNRLFHHRQKNRQR